MNIFNIAMFGGMLLFVKGLLGVDIQLKFGGVVKIPYPESSEMV